MKKTTIFLMSLAAALLTAACTKAEAGLKEKELHINAALTDQAPTTRSGKPFVGFTTLPYGFNYGLFVCQEGTTDKANAHKSNSYNLQATYYPALDKWTYNYVSNLSSGALSTENRDKVTLTARQDAKKADLYAYAPYVADAYAGGPEAIPYNVGNYTFNGSATNYEIDLMYAVENADSTNKGLDPEAEGSLNATFTFRHALSMLRFKITPHSGAYLAYKTIKATLNPGATVTKLYKTGTFNAVTGQFNDDGVEANSISESLTGGMWLTGYGYFLIAPTEVADDELYFTFTLQDGHTLQPYHLKKEHVKHDDGTYGFKSGYIYTFNFTLDNYLFLDGINISDDWTDALLGEEHI